MNDNHSSITFQTKFILAAYAKASASENDEIHGLKAARLLRELASSVLSQNRCHTCKK